MPAESPLIHPILRLLLHFNKAVYKYAKYGRNKLETKKGTPEKKGK